MEGIERSELIQPYSFVDLSEEEEEDDAVVEEKGKRWLGDWRGEGVWWL